MAASADGGLVAQADSEFRVKELLYLSVKKHLDSLAQQIGI